MKTKSLKFKVTFLLGLFATFMLVTAGFTFYVISAQSSDARVIDIAGRQRMLTQKMTKESLQLAAIVDNEDARTVAITNLVTTVALYDRSLNALKDGGTTLGTNGKDTTLPISEGEARIQLEKVAGLWNAFKLHIGAITDTSLEPTSPEFKSSLEAIRSGNIPLLKASNKAVGLLKEASEKKTALLKGVQLAAILTTILLVALSLYMANKMLFNPIKNFLAMLKDISEGEGDLTKRIAVTSEDEIGELAGHFNAFIGKLQGMIGEIKESASSLESHSRDLYTSSSQMEIDSSSMSTMAGSVATTSGEVSSNVATVANAAEVASDTVNNVSTAAGEMSQNMTRVASTTRDVLANANAVAAAIEEMSSTVSEITKNTTQAATISKNAATKAGEAETLMTNLSGSAETVGKVVEVINDIADRTNLLALNATIEAASAGEAGKGFAVVANEVKELAKQTAEATDEVVKQIEEMQDNTNAAVHAIAEIGATITEINNINTSIAATVEEQDATTNEVAQTTVHTVEAMEEVSRNVEEAAQGAGGVARNAAELSTGVTDITNNIREASERVNEASENIQMVNDAGSSALASVKEVNQSVDSLTQVTEGLNHLVNQFIIDEGGIDDGSPSMSNVRVKPLIPWNDRLSVHVNDMDAEHKRLIGYINDINEAIVLKKEKRDVIALIDALAEWTAKHFSHEEELMISNDYQGYDEQKGLHIKLIAQVEKIQNDLKSGADVDPGEILSFLKGWLTKHILRVDMRYKPFFNKRGVI
ncbi:MAG: bacteriohemerythrin [Thermodesulfobacteriota bacterium]